MARFSASGTDYSGNQRSRDIADEGLTRALERKARADKEKRIKESGKRSDVQKLLSAAARGAAAYYTAGASEAMGLGGAIDSAMLGTDSEGNAVRNEYGDLVGVASSTSSLMTTKKVADATARLNAQSAKDDAMQARMDKISPEAGLAYAQKREAKDSKNRGLFQDYKSGFLNFGQDIDGLDLSATTIDYSGISKNKKIEPPDPSVEFDDRNIGIMNTEPPEITTDDASENYKGDNMTEDQKEATSGTGAYAPLSVEEIYYPTQTVENVG